MPDNSQQTETEPKETPDFVKLIEQPDWKVILLDLVKMERMDPWNIDMVELADKYLQRINELGGKDLRLPANAILASAILLRFKAKFLKLSSLEEEDGAGLSEEDRKFLEQFIPDLKSVRKIREGKISLDMLVDNIEIMLEKSRKKESSHVLERIEAPEFMIPFAEENIDEKLDEVYAEVKAKADSHGLVTFSHLVENKNSMEVVDTFIPLLFLSNQGKVNIWQDEFFGEIYIGLLEEE